MASIYAGIHPQAAQVVGPHSTCVGTPRSDDWPVHSQSTCACSHPEPALTGRTSQWSPAHAHGGRCRAIASRNIRRASQLCRECGPRRAASHLRPQLHDKIVRYNSEFRPEYGRYPARHLRKRAPCLTRPPSTYIFQYSSKILGLAHVHMRPYAMRFSAALDFVPVLAEPSEHSPPSAHHWDHDSDAQSTRRHNSDSAIQDYFSRLEV